MTGQNNSAKFAFFYILSLIALVFVAVASGTILFQIINKLVPDIADIYSSFYQEGAMRFGISALIIASPIFYVTSRQIYRSLFRGSLQQDSGVRKWLTYLILLVSICVMIGWLIAILNEFLGGELTTRFILKALTAIIISGLVFSFYLYDIRRDNILNKIDRVISAYFYASLLIIIVILVAAFLNVGSPAQARDKKIDQNIINDYYQIQSGIDNYYNDKKVLPDSLGAIRANGNYINITDDNLKNKVTGREYEYKVINDQEFELCTDFKTSNKVGREPYRDTRWLHEAGYQCLRQKVNDFGKIVPPPVY